MASAEDQLRREYHQWKDAVPALYDMMVAHALEWPSMTAQWAHGHAIPIEDEPGYFSHKVN